MAVSCIGMGQAHAENVAVDKTLSADTAVVQNFTAEAKLTVNDGINITAGGVTTYENGKGTLEFLGASTVTGAIGADGTALNAINLVNSGADNKAVELNGATHTNAMTINYSSTGKPTISGTGDLTVGTLTNTAGDTTISKVTKATSVTVNGGSLNLSNAASTIETNAALNNNSTLTFGGTTLKGTVTGADGTLALSNTTAGQTVTGAVGTSGAKLNTVSTANTTGSTMFTGGVNATNLTVAGGGTISVRGNSEITNAITLTGGSGLTVGNSAKFTATNGITGGGTLELQDASGAEFGAPTSFDSITKTGPGTSVVEGAGTLTAGSLSVAADGTLQKDGGALIINGTTTLTNTGSLTLNSTGNTLTTLTTTGSGTSTLGGNGATTTITTLNVNDDGKLDVTNTGTSVAGTTTINTGATLDFAGSSLATVAGGGTLNLNGAGSQAVGTIDAATLSMTGAGAKTLNGVVTATNINIGSNVQANENLTGAINFTTDSTLTMAAGKSITGAVTTGTGGNGNITFGGGVTIGHAIGVAGTELKDVIFTAGENTINSSIYANTINLGSGIANLNTVTLRGNVTAAATTNIGDKQVTVDGQFNATNQTLNYSVNSAATAGMVTVRGADGTGTGTVNVATGTKVNVTVNTSEYIAQNQEYVLIGGGAGGNVQMLDAADLKTNNTALLTFKQKADTNSLIVFADRTAMNTTAKDKNSAAAGAMLDQIGGGGDAAVQDLQIRLGAMGTAAEVEATLATLVPDLSGGAVASTVNTSNMTGGVVGGRVNALRSGDSSYGTGVASGNALESGHIWAQGFGATSDQDRRDGVAGYDADTYGVVFGIDTDITDQIRAGIALAYSNSDIKSDNASRTKTDIDSYQVMLYGDMDLSDNYFVSGQLAYLYNDIDTTRYNVGGIAGNTARADFHSNQYVARAELGKNIALDNGFTLTPSALVNYNFVDTSSYTEKGAGGLGLSNVRSDDLHILEFGVNMMGAVDLEDGHGGLVTPNVHAGYRYDVIGDSVATTAGLVGAGNAAFKTEGFDPSQHTVNVGTGIKWTTANNLDLSVNYDYEHKSDYDAHSGYVRAGFKF